MTDRDKQPVHLKISGYEHLKESDRAKIDKMLRDMKKQKDLGLEPTLPNLKGIK